MEKANKQIIGNVGLFYVSYKISLLGFYAIPTIRNSKGPDLLVYNDKSFIGIQVKTLSKINDINLGKNFNSTENIKFWIEVFNCIQSTPECLILPYSILKSEAEKRIHGDSSYKNIVICDRPKLNGTINNFWINRKCMNKENIYYEKWDLIQGNI